MKSDRFFVLLDRAIDLCDSWRDGALQALFASRFLRPLRKAGLTADLLTTIRAVLAVMVFAFLIENIILGYDPRFGNQSRVFVLVILATGFLTDLLDGPLARVERRTSSRDSARGAHFDPFVDKLFTLPILMFYLPAMGWIAGSIGGLTIVGDTAAIAVRRYSARRGIVIPSNRFGKYKMAFLCLAIFMLAWQYPKAQDIVFGAMVTSMTLGVISLGTNARNLKRQLDAQGIISVANQT
ncbi:MAG: CDP-alcohol phosphatidyltransferase family protein [bacterium]|nr:CDP-alcohol phosphatidyltransferase family protein [bacterium]